MAIRPSTARPHTPRPVVLTRDEAEAILERMRGDSRLVASLMYGSGLRLMECVRLRVRDLEFGTHTILVRDEMETKGRTTILPAALVAALKRHLERIRAIHRRDLEDGYGEVRLPGAVRRQHPDVARGWRWQWVFPQRNRWVNPVTGEQGRHYLDPAIAQRAVRRAVRVAGVTRRATCRTFRHSFASHLREDGYDVRTIQKLLGHEYSESPWASRLGRWEIPRSTARGGRSQHPDDEGATP